MDPNATLDDMRRLVAKYDLDGMYSADEILGALVEDIRALDGWLSGGGFFPLPWRKELGSFPNSR